MTLRQAQDKIISYKIVLVKCCIFLLPLFCNAENDTHALEQIKQKLLQRQKQRRNMVKQTLSKYETKPEEKKANLSKKTKKTSRKRLPKINVAPQTCIETQCEENNRWALTFKNGFFYPQECILREIFDRCGSKGGYWPELAIRYNCWKELYIEASGSYFKREGRALNSDEWTEVSIPTFGFGLKYFFNQKDFYDDCDNWLDRCSFFLGGGLRVFFYREKSCPPFFPLCIKKTTVGGMVNAGFEVQVCKNLFIDLFVDYNIKKMYLDCDDISLPYNNQPNNVCGDCCPSCIYDIHIGGLVAGVGIGCMF